MMRFPNTSDTVQDDTAALQALLDAAPEGGIPSLPPGDYFISAPLVVRSNHVSTCLRARDAGSTIP